MTNETSLLQADADLRGRGAVETHSHPQKLEIYQKYINLNIFIFILRFYLFNIVYT